MKKYNGLIDEVLFYSERDENGEWIIPIEVDWDFTITKCSSWEKGEMIMNEDAFKVMRRWSEEYNVGWILNSMRNDKLLEEPIAILEKEGIKLYGIRKNPIQTNSDEDQEVTKSFAVMSIDDRGIGIPHKWMENCERPHVDWIEVDKITSPILKHISDTLKKVRM